jgi:hypothetical protein
MTPRATGRWSYCILVLVGGSALVWLAWNGSFAGKDLGAGLFAMLGTFLGALLAFRLQQAKEAAAEVARRKAALNRALLVLGVHYNGISNHLPYLAPFKTDIELAFNLPALQPPERTVMQQKFDELDFLIESETPQVLLDLIVEQDRYEQAMQAIRQRNSFYVDHVQPQLALHGLNETRVSNKQLRETIGDYLFGGALQGAVTMKEHLVASNTSLPQAAAALRAVAKRLYPNEKFVQFDG